MPLIEQPRTEEVTCGGEWRIFYPPSRDGGDEINERFSFDRCNACNEWMVIQRIGRGRPQRIWHFTPDTTLEEVLRHILNPQEHT